MPAVAVVWRGYSSRWDSRFWGVLFCECPNGGALPDGRGSVCSVHCKPSTARKQASFRHLAADGREAVHMMPEQDDYEATSEIRRQKVAARYTQFPADLGAMDVSP